MRFAYDYSPQTVQELEEAIQEAWEQAAGLMFQAEFAQTDVLTKEARRWADRAVTLQMQLESVY